MSSPQVNKGEERFTSQCCNMPLIERMPDTPDFYLQCSKCGKKIRLNYAVPHTPTEEKQKPTPQDDPEVIRQKKMREDSTPQEDRGWEEELPQMITDLVYAVTDGGQNIKPNRWLSFQEEPVPEFEAIRELIQSSTKQAEEEVVREIKELIIDKLTEPGGKLKEDDTIMPRYNYMQKTVIRLIESYAKSKGLNLNHKEE